MLLVTSLRTLCFRDQVHASTTSTSNPATPAGGARDSTPLNALYGSRARKLQRSNTCNVLQDNRLNAVRLKRAIFRPRGKCPTTMHSRHIG